MMMTYRHLLFFIGSLSLFGCSTESADIKNNIVETLYFPPLNSSTWETSTAAELNWNLNNVEPLRDYLESKNTKAFIILKNGKIVLEYYLNGFQQNDLWYWASTGKTLTATTVGIAQQEGFLNINDTSSDYLGTNWSSTTLEQEGNITLLNQLTMTSGLNDLFFDCTTPECLLFKADASTRWAYHNGPYTLLQSVTTNATSVNFETYFNNKLRDVIGMNGSWFSTNGLNNVYFSNARSMARFGLLILNKGKWDTTEVVNEDYVMQMTNTSQSLNLSYGYLWWLNGKESYRVPQSQTVNNGSLIPNAPNELIAGLGKNDQKLYIIPSENLVIVRLGDAAGEELLGTSSFDNELWEKLNSLMN